MRTYEVLYIVRPELSDEEVEKIAQEVEAMALEGGGNVVEKEIWGKRKLAYEVKGCTEGHYVLLRFEGQSEVLPKLTQHFKLSEQIIRDLIVHFDEKTLRLEAEQKKRAESDVRGARDRDDDDDDRPRRRDRDDDRPPRRESKPAPAEASAEAPAEEAAPVAVEAAPEEAAEPEAASDDE
jgi:small subunit ribosomal protein S6